MPAQVGFGFDCVIKAFRTGLSVSRHSWFQPTKVFYNREDEKVHIEYHDAKNMLWQPSSDDMMAKDWYVILPEKK